MAVLLCRSDGKPFPTPPPPEMRGLPRIVVVHQPLPDHSEGKLISMRTKSQYSTEEPRGKFWKNTYRRHQEQLTQCGFHTPISKPYKDVGEVIMDDSKLILEGLGQSERRGTPVKHKIKKLDTDEIPQPASMVPPYRVRFHSKTPSRSPVELWSLDQKINQGNTQLEHMKWGRDLYKIIKEEREEKEIKTKELAQQNRDAFMNQWREAKVASDFIMMEDGYVVRQGDPLDQHDTEFEKTHYSNSAVVNGESSSKAGLTLSAANENDCVAKEEEEADRTVYHWYRRLCVLIWILDAMQLESPNYATPFFECWNINRPKMDEANGQKMYEGNRVQLSQWYDLYKSARAQKNMCCLRNKISSYMTFRKSSSITNCSKMSCSYKGEDGSTRKSTQESLPSTASSKNVGSYRGPSQLEEEKIRKQKKLTPAQMYNLVTMLDDELNYSQKQSRTRMNALIKETSAGKKKATKISDSRKKAWQVPSVSLDVSALQMEFIDSDEARRMIVHEQLTAMERDREKAIHQRLHSLRISGNLQRDLAGMRQGVEIETTEMARRKLLMNYNWYEELLSLLPSEVRKDHYCLQLLESLFEIADYMSKNGPEKMSKKKLMQVLAILRPWELEVLDVEAAIKFLIKRVIYIAKEDYSKWLEQHNLVYRLKERGKKQSNSTVS